jgi:hypothetical protein
VASVGFGLFGCASGGVAGDEQQGVSPDSGRHDDAGGVGPGCVAVAAGSPVELVDPEGFSFAYSRFVATEEGVVGVYGGAITGGRRLIFLDRSGAPRRPPETLWPDQLGAQSSELALSGDVLAVVDQSSVGVNARQTCRMGILRVSDSTSILAPMRVSDLTEDDSIVNEVQYCRVAAVRDGFFVVWQQNTSRTSLEWSLFGQEYGTDGVPRGARVVIASGGDFSKADGVGVVFDGVRPVVHYAVIGASAPTGGSLAFVEDGGVRTVALDAAEPVALDWAHGGFLVQTNGAAWLLDAAGERLVDPVALPGARVAPLGDGYVSVANDEYLVARALDERLGAPSPPEGLSLDRGATLHQLVYAPNVTFTAAVIQR